MIKPVCNAVLTTALMMASCWSQAAGKVALVIGNSEYKVVADRLKNPVNDAKAMAQLLKAEGYQTTLLLNAGLDSMLDNLNRVKEQVDAGGAIDLMDEAASRLRMEVESKPEEIEAMDRRIIQLKIEREALKKETDQASKDRLATLEEDLANLEQQSAELTARWQGEKDKINADEMLASSHSRSCTLKLSSRYRTRSVR